MRRTGLILSLSVLLVGAVACGSTSPAGEGSPTTTSSSTGLEGRTFISQSATVDGTTRDLVGGATAVRLAFESGHVSASAGCNDMTGDYQLEGGALQVGQLATTAMGCDPALDTQDGWIAELLQSHPGVTLDGDDLVLTNATTVLRLVDRRVVEPDLPLTGRTWKVDTLIDHGGASSVPVGEATPTLTFGADGQVVVFDGCTTSGGTADISPTTVAITFTAQTSHVLCAGPTAELAGRVHAVLAGPMTYRISASHLTLTAGEVGLGLTA